MVTELIGGRLVLSLAITAAKIASLGFSVIPIQPTGKKPTVSWLEYQTQIMPSQTIEKSFKDGCKIAVICGEVSGGLEVIDFDTLGKGDAPHFQTWANLMNDNGFGELLRRLVIAKTPSGGRHVFYRCPGHVVGNQPLARSKESVIAGDGTTKSILIETRGDRGYVLVAPSKGYEWFRGDYESIPEVTPAEREIINGLGFE